MPAQYFIIVTWLIFHSAYIYIILYISLLLTISFSLGKHQHIESIIILIKKVDYENLVVRRFCVCERASPAHTLSWWDDTRRQGPIIHFFYPWVSWPPVVNRVLVHCGHTSMLVFSRFFRDRPGRGAIVYLLHITNCTIHYLGCVHFTYKPKIFPLSSITSNFWTHAWTIKCR
jgi:hypothetical protein